jgi:hypothetical protein
MPAPTPEEMGPLLSPETEALDEPTTDPYADENGEFMAAARAAVGNDQKATALKDAITACLREHGLLPEEPATEPDEFDEPATVGSGFPNL